MAATVANAAINGDGSCRSMDELPLSALSEIVARMGPRPDNLLSCCRSTRRLHGDLSTWQRWMLHTYGAGEALHKLRHSRWLNIDNESQVIAAVSMLLSSGADPNLNEERTGFWTPSILRWSVTKGFTHLVDLLVKSGANTRDEDIVCAAAAQGNLRVLETIVSSVPDHEFTLWRDHAFLHSASGGEVASAAWLLDRGADMNVNEGQGLFEAAYHGHVSVVQLLVDRGAELRARNDGALIAAAFKGHLQVAQLLLSKGADVNSQRGRALVQAASCGHLDMCKLLLTHTPSAPVIKEALEAASRKGLDSTVACLLEWAAPVDPVVHGAALFHAATHNHPAVVRLLVRAGINALAALDSDTVTQMVRDGRHASLAAIEEEAEAMGEPLVPSLWGLDLPSFLDDRAMSAERKRLAQLMLSTASLSVLCVQNH